MKFDPQEIRRAMDSRLSFLDADSGRRARIRSRITKEGEPVVKRKITAGMVLAIVLALVLAGVALAAGLNIFDYFGDQDTRYAQIAPQSELATQEPVTVESDGIGTTTAAITNAYYDGNSLLVAYTIENSTRREAFTPTDAQLAEMTKMESAMPVLVENDTEDSLVRQYNEALQSGTPFGYVTYCVYPSDHTTTGEGEDLVPSTETADTDADGTEYTIREYETPLPDREYLQLEIKLWQSVSYMYFDGTDAYTMRGEREVAGTMTATVWRADADKLHMTGNGLWQGVDATLEAEVSAMHAELVITTADELPAENEDECYNIILRDENGNILRAEIYGRKDAHTISGSFRGTGSLPETLTVELLLYSEDGGETAMPPILLTTTEE